ncbi:HNH endonuclease [Flammeovirga sp. SJP92]|uniref:HNH endonuclease n=1 Tax=Flammeovirga sp. SJP92 TaxID=1775430 RepID=UPI000788C6C7|nr:hypothetical protein [Flammeovirga sp. SJP92]KXX72491.1 hypothetical protein AVL50_00025 [Flammeovirga sp. SJP92]
MLKIEINNRVKQEELFYKNLNPKKKDGTFMKRSTHYKLKNEYHKATTKIDKEVYRFLLIRLKNILIGSPFLLNEIITLFNDKYSTDIFYTTNSKGKIVDSTIGNNLKRIFNYDTFRQSKFCIDYLKELGFEQRIPCPYCNFDELSIVTRDVKKSKLALLDLDHFVPQSKYPFLALSMYNLVPSCHNCNSRFKGEILFLINTHINPFDKSFENYFQFQLENPFIYGMDLNKFQITFESINGFSDKSIRDLCLIERYNTAKAQLLEKFNLIAKMTPSKKNEIEAIFNEKVDEDLLEVAEIPKCKEQVHLYKLGKLKRDIYEGTWCKKLI